MQDIAVYLELGGGKNREKKALNNPEE